MYNHLSELYYIFHFPHLSGSFAAALLIGFWVPLIWHIEKHRWEAREEKVFNRKLSFIQTTYISPYTSPQRTLYRALFNTLIHVIIQKYESFMMGYKWSNVMALMVMNNYITIFSAVGTYL